MKSLMILCVFSVAMFVSAHAQVKTKGNVAKKSVAKQPIKKTPSQTTPVDGTLKISTLTSSSDYAAKNDSAQGINRLSISDPITRSFSERAKGADIKLSSSGIVGMPKGTYGFANGRITFISSGSTSTGGVTGVGTVGTGSGLGSIGSDGLRGVNGKSPYAGSSMWGNARNLNVLRDSTTRAIGQ